MKGYPFCVVDTHPEGLHHHTRKTHTLLALVTKHLPDDCPACANDPGAIFYRRTAGEQAALARNEGAFETADLLGWSPFGTHLGPVDGRLEFRGESDCGDPLWERVVPDYEDELPAARAARTRLAKQLAAERQQPTKYPNGMYPSNYLIAMLDRIEQAAAGK